jgi:hypothetical protein
MNAWTGSRDDRFGPSNEEMVSLSNVNNQEAYTLPYIYDEFTWSHCDGDFTNLLVTLKEESESSNNNHNHNHSNNKRTVKGCLVFVLVVFSL